MTVTGVDYAWGRPSTDALRGQGVVFACRYLSYDKSGKNLTFDEAARLCAAGIAVVSNWEYATQAALNGHAQGVADATEADRQHRAAGGPADRPIYFSVDFDATPGQQAAINDYFDGVASVIGLQRTGAYGGYWVIKRLFDAGKISWGWQAYAWSGGNWDGRAHLRQIRNGVRIDKVDTDLDQAMTVDFGQWSHGAGPAPAPPPSPHTDNWTETLVQNLPTLHRGSSGQAVRVIQAELGAWGHATGIDGDFGPDTDAKVRAFQHDHGLQVDGVVGRHTHAVLKTGQDL